jgi:hypothetical protein
MRAILLLLPVLAFAADPVPVVSDLDLQPLAAQARRIIEATEYLGEPLSDADKKAINAVGADAE